LSQGKGGGAANESCGCGEGGGDGVRGTRGGEVEVERGGDVQLVATEPDDLWTWRKSNLYSHKLSAYQVFVQC